MRADRRPPHGIRILVHALFPIIAHALHCWYPAIPITSVLDVFPRANGHLGQRLGGDFLGRFVDVGADGGPEGVDDVDEEKHQEDVEEELGVVR